MANRPSGQTQPSSTVGITGTPIFTEPEVRRWPHPVETVAPVSLCSQASEGDLQATLSCLCRTLSQQSQLLSEIKSLLEHQSTEPAQAPGEK